MLLFRFDNVPRFPQEFLATPFRSALLFSALCLCFAAGCGSGGGDAPELGTVSGTVTLDGSPLRGAMVTFYPAAGRASFGETDAQGRYELSYKTDVPGAVVGQHTVRITTADPQAVAGGESTETLPAVYNSRSTLSARVEAGENSRDFQLMSRPEGNGGG